MPAERMTKLENKFLVRILLHNRAAIWDAHNEQSSKHIKWRMIQEQLTCNIMIIQTAVAINIGSGSCISIRIYWVKHSDTIKNSN